MGSKKFPIPLKDNQFTELGQLTAAFSFLEYCVKTCIHRFIDNKHTEGLVGPTVTIQLNFIQSVKLIQSLFYLFIKDDALRLQFDGYRKKFENANSQRNRIIHSLWGSSDDDARSIGLKPKIHPRKGLQVSKQYYSTGDISKYATSFIALGHDALNFMWDCKSDQENKS